MVVTVCFLRDFNPRSREGSDDIEIRISKVDWNFNPRSREGSDIKIAIQTDKTINDFNPRSREGSDKDDKIYTKTVKDFNPRSREGSDYIKWYTNTVTMISIHAPAKGATCRYCNRGGLNGFQSTLPRRERLVSHTTRPIRSNISIHAPAKGATAFINIFSLAVRLFFISSHQ